MTANTEIRCVTCQARNRIPIAATGRPRCAKCHADLPWLANATGADLDRLLPTSALPVLIDLWAPWCGPCRTIAPMLEELARRRAGSLRIVKVNVDIEPAVSAQLGVQGIPTIVLFHHGKELSRQVGALPLDRLTHWLDESLAGTDAPTR